VSGPVDFSEKVALGRSGLRVSRLGIGSSFGVSTQACLEAFDAGVNYFFWGSARTAGMALAIRELAPSHREDLRVVLQCYARKPSWVSRSIRKGLKTLGLQYADVLLLGWHERPLSPRLLAAVEREREAGTFRHLAISSHQRPLFRDFWEDGRYGIFHIRYNAAHTGAEEDLFPYLPGPPSAPGPGGHESPEEAAGSDEPERNGPGIVAFTCLRWGDLLNKKKMPAGEAPLTASECYRFALSHPRVHVAICGPKSDEEMGHALGVLQAGPLDEGEMARVRAIGEHVYRQRSVADWFR
jgi:aryl-alcohol dehydrogenase-like predicted oxidoreductase